MRSHTIAMFASAPSAPIPANSDILPKRRRARCTRKVTPCRIDAFDSPSARSWNRIGTSAARRSVRTSSSSRILNPLGRSVERSRRERSTRKNPVIGSLVPCSRRGNIDLVRMVAARDTPNRRVVPSPVESPPPMYREATTTSASPRA